MRITVSPIHLPGFSRGSQPVDTHLAGKKVLLAMGRLMIAMVVAMPVRAQMILEEVLVVAQKRTQRLQEVPVAVTAFSGQDLEISGINDVFDLSNIAPGLNVRQAGNYRATAFRIRGIGTYAQNFGLESSVGLYVDGVYRSRQGAMVNNMVDMASVEVLRGPQGTLFGRNTLAGAVLMNTAAPGHDGSDGFAELTAGNYGLLNVSGAASISAIEDELAFRVSAFSSGRDGFVDDIHFGENKIFERDRWGVRLQALYTPMDFLSIRVVTDYSEIDEICCAGLVVQDNLRPVALPEGATPYAGTDEVALALDKTVFTADQYYDYTSAFNTLPVTGNEDGGISVTVDWDSDIFSLTSITGYRSYDYHGGMDSDFSDINALKGSSTADQSAWSQELRISNEGEILSYVVGLYYFSQQLDSVDVLEFKEEINDIYSHTAVWYAGTNGQFPLKDLASFPLPSLPLFPPNAGTVNTMEQEHEAYAVFAQADYDLSDTLMLTAGLRYTKESKDLSGVFTEGSAPEFTDGVTAIPIITSTFQQFAPQDPVNESLSDEQVTGTFKLSWFTDENVMLYASYATGYKSGGTNTDRINPELDYVFEPETSEALEIGMKADFPEQGLRVNLALHKTDIDDLQVNYLAGDGFVLQNAGRLETYGGELEVTWLPTETLTLTGAYAKTMGEFEDFENGACWTAYPFHTGQPDPGDSSDGENTVACHRSGYDLHNNPDFLSFSANQVFNLSDRIGGFLLVEYSLIGKSDSTSHDPFERAPEYELVNLRLGIEFEKYDAAVTLWGRNVLDEEYRMTAYSIPGANGRVLATPGEPVTYGVTLRKNF